MQADSRLLDLCAGNGLFSVFFSETALEVTSVDISQYLLDELESKSIPNVTTLHGDMRKAEFEPESFTHIFLYAGIQYIDHAETVELFRKMFRWLAPEGRIFIGDIPDSTRIWAFYNTEERRRLYFDSVIAGNNIVGTWFDPVWLKCLAEDVGYRKAEILPQNDKLIYAHFRYDMRLEK